MNVNNTGAVNGQTLNAAKPADSQNTLGQDAFLKILVTQMKYQDPMEPLKDTEFIGQMAQFSSLEQLTQLNKTMNDFVAQQKSQSLSGNGELIGNSVSWEQEVDGQKQSGQGVVNAVTSKNGEIWVELDNGNLKVPVDAVNRI